MDKLKILKETQNGTDVVILAEWLVGERAECADSAYMTDHGTSAKNEVLEALLCADLSPQCPCRTSVLYSEASMVAKSYHRVDPDSSWRPMHVAVSDAEFEETRGKKCLLYDRNLKKLVALKDEHGEYQGFTQVKLYLSSFGQEETLLPYELPSEVVLLPVDTNNRLIKSHWFSCGQTTPFARHVSEIPSCWRRGKEADERWCDLVNPLCLTDALIVCTRDGVPQHVQTNADFRVLIANATVADTGYGMRAAKKIMEFVRCARMDMEQVRNSVNELMRNPTCSFLSKTESKQLLNASVLASCVEDVLIATWKSAEKAFVHHRTPPKGVCGLYGSDSVARERGFPEHYSLEVNNDGGRLSTVSENIGPTFNYAVLGAPRMEVFQRQSNDELSAVISLMDNQNTISTPYTHGTLAPEYDQTHGQTSHHVDEPCEPAFGLPEPSETGATTKSRRPTTDLMTPGTHGETSQCAASTSRQRQKRTTSARNLPVYNDRAIPADLAAYGRSILKEHKMRFTRSNGGFNIMDDTFHVIRKARTEEGKNGKGRMSEQKMYQKIMEFLQQQLQTPEEPQLNEQPIRADVQKTQDPTPSETPPARKRRKNAK